MAGFFMQNEIGDKVKIKYHNGLGERGVLEAIADDQLVIRLIREGRVVSASIDSITNFSLAARKAWRNMPNRRVGRPRGARHCDRVSVTLRIDRELWERFKKFESAGLIEDRTARINACLRALLDRLEETMDGGDAT